MTQKIFWNRLNLTLLCLALHKLKKTLLIKGFFWTFKSGTFMIGWVSKTSKEDQDHG